MSNCPECGHYQINQGESWAGDPRAACNCCAGCKGLKERITRLTEALRTYGQHGRGCHEEGHSCKKGCLKYCTCGLDVALTEWIGG